MLKLSKSPEETEKIAREIVGKYSNKIFCLYGDLGAGKTTFIRGAARSLGIKDKIQSPTFAYERIYVSKKVSLYHFDFYRINPNASSEDTILHDLDSAISDKKGIVFVEWADNAKHGLPKNRVDVYFQHCKGSLRKIRVKRPMTDKDVADAVREFHVPLHVRKHCAAVAKIAVMIGQKLLKRGYEIDVDSVRCAALVHDLVRVVDFRKFQPSKFPNPFSKDDLRVWKRLRKTYKGWHHAAAAANLLEDMGFDDVAQIVSKHRYLQIVKGFSSWEEKLLYYADKRVQHDSVVELRERLKGGRLRNLPNLPRTKSDIKIEKKVFALEREIYRKAGIKTKSKL